ncbi:MAG: SLC13 family permease [Planctomycetota bacterium]
MDPSFVVFLFVYAAMIFGGVPGLRLDRTGAALVGAILLCASGVLSPVAAWQAIDVGTIGLLLGLMLVSAQFRLGGFYSHLTYWLAARRSSPERLLFELVLVTGSLSALLTNDVVCLAIAPVLIDICRKSSLDPVPFLLALCAASNTGSCATLIGNPQNMLIGQSLQISFTHFLLDGVVPGVLGLGVVFFVLARAYRGRFSLATTCPQSTQIVEQVYDRTQTRKGILILTALTVGLMCCPLPREVLAMMAGSVVLISRRQSTYQLLAQVDWPLLLLFAALFIINHALTTQGHPAEWLTSLRAHGIDVTQPVTLFLVTVLGSNLISNVPLVMLLLPAATHQQAGPILALSSTLSGNLFLVGSIANLIVVEQATRLSVKPMRGSWTLVHLRTGLPIALLTLSLSAGWLWLRAQFAN